MQFLLWEANHIPVGALRLLVPVEVKHFVKEVFAHIKYELSLLGVLLPIRVDEADLVLVEEGSKTHLGAVFNNRVRLSGQVEISALAIMDSDLV